MKQFRHYSAIGMPYHGLAVDGVLTKPAPVGDVTVAGEGACTVVRNHTVPTITRTTEQIAQDTALGREWRDYLLLTGQNRHVGGAGQIQGNSWICCDDSGVPWVLQLRQREAVGAVLPIEVWRVGLFGHFGRDYSAITTAKIAEFSWTPTIPAWYAGPYTVNELVTVYAQVALDWVSIVPSEDGRSVLLNLTLSGAIVESMFPELRIGGDAVPSARALVGVLAITISGSGDKATDGSGLSVAFNLTHDIDDLYVLRDVIAESAPSGGVTYEWYNGSNPVPSDDPEPSPGATETTTESAQFRYAPGSQAVPYTQRHKNEYRTIVHKTHDSTVYRYYLYDRVESVDRTAGGGYTSDVEWEYFGGWTQTGCSGATSNAFTEEDYSFHQELTLRFEIDGVTFSEFSAVHHEESNTRQDSIALSSSDWAGARCSGTQSPTPSPVVTTNHYMTVNGETYNFADYDSVHETDFPYRNSIQLNAGNMCIAQMHYPAPDGVNRNLHYAAVTWDGPYAASVRWSDSSLYPNPVAGAIDQWQTWIESMSYQPVTGEFTIDEDNLTFYQYC